MAQIKDFSISEALKFGFNTLINNFGLFLKINLVFALMYMVMGFLIGLTPMAQTNVGSVGFNPVVHITPAILALFTLGFGLLSFLIKEYYIFQITRTGLALYDKQPTEWKSVLELKNFFNFLGARSLFIIKAFLGFLLFIIPGVYIYCKYLYTGFPIIDGKAVSVKEDKHIAAEVTNGVRWKIFGFQVITSLLMGVAVMGIITILLIPAFLLAQVYVYRTLLAQTEQPAEVSPLV